MPKLETLKKRAKLLVRWHRERNYTVAERIRAVLPRYRGMSDKAILAGKFTLAEAQALIAREAGFASWAALKQGAATMPDQAKPQAKPTTTAPTLVSAEPQLFVRDIRAACTYFADKLGFWVVFVYGEPPFYGQVKRDTVHLNLRLVCEPVFAGDVREREQLLAAAINVENVKALFMEFAAKRVDFQQTLEKQPWGATNFVVRDPDGNLILFA